MKPLQIIIIVVCILAAVGGLFALALFRGDDNAAKVGSVEIWGVLPKTEMNSFISDVKARRKDMSGIVYREVAPVDLVEEYLTAVAQGQGPDLLLVPHSTVFAQEATLNAIPYETIPERDFDETFVEAASTLKRYSGVIGVPFLLDPIILISNKTLLSSGSIARPPQTWDEVFVLAPRLTKVTSSRSIQESAIALGDIRNMAHGYDVLSALFLQAGTPIMAADGPRYRSFLNDDMGYATIPAHDALRFFAEFSNPGKTVYSWNRALPQDRTFFLAGDLALFLGAASDLPTLRAENANLSYMVSLMPQTKGSSARATYATLYTFAVPKGAQNPAGATLVALELAGSTSQATAEALLGLPPSRRDLLTATNNNAEQDVLRESAILARTWYDPNSESTQLIFRDMVDSVVTGRSDISTAVSQASRQLEGILR